MSALHRIKVTTHCQATVTEEWTLEVTDEQLAEIRALEADSEVGDAAALAELHGTLGEFLNGKANYVNVENVAVDNEQDRTVEEWSVVEPDYVTPKP